MKISMKMNVLANVLEDTTHSSTNILYHIIKKR